MLKIRIHGRGGQGAKTAAKIIGMAAYLEGKCAQAFSIYGAERRGSPVAAFVRIDDKEILERGYVHDPNFVMVLDDTLLDSKEIGIFSGLSKRGTVVVNTRKKIKAPKGVRLVTVDATEIALETIGKPIFNTTMLGAFVKLSRAVKMDSVKEAMYHMFERRKKHLMGQNLRAIERCYNEVES